MKGRRLVGRAGTLRYLLSRPDLHERVTRAGMAFVAGRRSLGTARVPIVSGHLGAQGAPRGTPGVEVVILYLIGSYAIDHCFEPVVYQVE